MSQEWKKKQVKLYYFKQQAEIFRGGGGGGGGEGVQNTNLCYSGDSPYCGLSDQQSKIAFQPVFCGNQPLKRRKTFILKVQVKLIRLKSKILETFDFFCRFSIFQGFERL